MADVLMRQVLSGSADQKWMGVRTGSLRDLRWGEGVDQAKTVGLNAE